MDDLPEPLQPANPVVVHLLDQLRSHPKRVVFTEGEDIRVIRAAARLVREGVVAPILIGDRANIHSLAAENRVPMKFINAIDPKQSSNFPLFCRRMENMDRFRDRRLGQAEDLVARPHYFGALMVQYGQADAIVGGNQAIPAAYFRALMNTIKPNNDVPKIFAVSLILAPHLRNIGQSGMLFLADTALLAEPEIQELGTIAVETGKLAQHFLGRKPTVAMLSHSTHGSSPSTSSRKMAAATGMARNMAAEKHLDLEITGEVQADVALDPVAAEFKLPGAEVRPSADVLVFPNLDASHIGLKLLQHTSDAHVLSHILMGLSRPAAQIPRTATDDTIFGTAAAIAVEAIKFHQLYPESDY